MNSKRAMAQLLKHLTGLGVTHLPKVEVQVRRVAAEAARAAAPAEVPAAAGARRAVKPSAGTGGAAAVQPLRRIPGLEEWTERVGCVVRVRCLRLSECCQVRWRRRVSVRMPPVRLQLVAGCRRCSGWRTAGLRRSLVRAV